jgi:hypothetical protein
MSPNDPAWNFMDPASKKRVLDVLEGEMDAMFQLMDDPARWEAPTACEKWQARDVVGHLADVSSDGVQFSPGNIDDCDAVLEFDPATLVLTGYARMNGGTARGDEELAGTFRDLFFPI